MRKSLDQSAYDYFYKILKTERAQVYPINPPAETPYPFIQAGIIRIIPIPTKLGGLARLAYSFDVWGAENDRALVSEIAISLMGKLTNANETEEHFHLRAIKGSQSIEVAPDNSTNDDLWRASCSLEFQAY